MRHPRSWFIRKSAIAAYKKIVALCHHLLPNSLTPLSGTFNCCSIPQVNRRRDHHGLGIRLLEKIPALASDCRGPFETVLILKWAFCRGWLVVDIWCAIPLSFSHHVFVHKPMICWLPLTCQSVSYMNVIVGIQSRYIWGMHCRWIWTNVALECQVVEPNRVMST